MKALARNKQTVYYALLSSVTDETVGNYKTGEKAKSYTTPVEMRVNVSAARGTADVEQFGVNDNYDRTIATDDMACPIDETSILWVGVPATDAQGNVLPHNYKVVRVAKSLNSIMYAIRKVSVT